MITNVTIIIIITTTTTTTTTTTNNNNNNKERHSGKARNQRTTENSNIWHWTVLWKVRLSQYRTLNVGNNIPCSTDCNYRTAATLCTVGTRFGSFVQL
jgi:hypothetical protein